MAIRVVQLGTPRAGGEGPRFGTVRRPPRGVRKSDYASQNWYDVWLPNLSPTAALMRETRVGEKDADWRAFERRFRAQLREPERSHLLDALAALSHVTSFSIGCYCDDEKRCHRSILRSELEKRGAVVK